MNSKATPLLHSRRHRGHVNASVVQVRVAQPALNHQIAGLEGELGKPLSVKHRRGVDLT